MRNKLTLWNETKLDEIHKAKLDGIHEMKRNFTLNEISLVFLFRETSEISRNNCFVWLCFVFCETKKEAKLEILIMEVGIDALALSPVFHMHLQVLKR
jgi:hypothetical protein